MRIKTVTKLIIKSKTFIQNKVLTRILFLLTVLFLVAQSFAFPTDSLKRKKPSTLNDTWFYGAEPNKHFIIDTSISQLHRFNVVQGDGQEYFNLGNSGTAAFPLIFDTRKKTGFDFGFNQFDVYRYKKDSVKYYQVIRPYTELSYTIGLKAEQVFQGKFANSHGKNFYYGVDFRRVDSKGTYTNQSSVVNGFSLYGVFNSKNKRWNVQTDLLFNNARVRENGGLKTDIFRTDTVLFSKTLAPVYIGDDLTGWHPQNKVNEVDWYLKAGYNIGKKYTERINDSTTQKTLLPIFRISYQFNVEKNQYSYLDKKPDTAYYKDFYTIPDSLYSSHQFLKVGNQISFDFMAKKLTSDSTFQEKNFLAGAAVGFDYYLLDQNKRKHDFGNAYVSGYIKSNPALNSMLIYNARAQYYFAGYNQNDLLIEGRLGVDLRKFGRLTADVLYQLKQADWNYHYFTAGNAIWQNNFPKSNTLKFGGTYTLEKYGISISAHDYVLKNYFYFSAPDQPKYDTKTVNVVVVNFSNRFGIKGFHLDNDIWFQKESSSDAIRLPWLVTKHSVYYERKVFKKFLWFAFGVDLRYYAPFYSNSYSPVTGQFFTQNNKEMTYYPVLDVFLNFKIKSVRVFLTGTNLSRGLKQTGYYTAYLYPAADIGFKFGLKWRFFE